MAVVSRSILDVNYRLQDARIYDKSDLTAVTKDHTNNSTVPQTTQFRLLYKNSIWMTWDCRSVSASLSDVPTTIAAGVPSIVDDGRVEVTDTFKGFLKWGQATELPKEAEVSHSVTVPPMTRVKVSLVVTQGKCDVPFSYSVRDFMVDGTVVTYPEDDGAYTGANNYNYKFVTTEEPLPLK